MNRPTDVDQQFIPGTLDETVAPISAHLPSLPGMSPVAPALDAKRFRQALEHRSHNRKLLIDWIAENLVDGTDYGRIHFIKKSECPDGAQCTNPFHWSKPSLWKPGAEKICGMLGWTVTFPNLDDYTRMTRAGRPIASIVFRCVLVDGFGRVVGEGIGARQIEKDGGDLNKALKMAKKSAHIDATLVAAGLSEIFTQDTGDDGDPEDGKPAADQYVPNAQRGTGNLGGAKLNLETHCTIGTEWRGRKWEEVDGGFLNWIVDHITDKPDLRARAQKELERRQVDQRAQTSAQTGEPAPAEERGSRDLAKHAREIAMAKNVAMIDAAWAETPQRFRVPLKKAYDTSRNRLIAEQQTSASSDER